MRAVVGWGTPGVSVASAITGRGACPICVRRSWLLAELSPLLDYHRARRGRLIDLLALPDEDLIDALAGSRRDRLRRSHGERLRSAPDMAADRGAFCRHDRRYPDGLRDAGAPWMLNVAGGVDRLVGLLGEPVVAILAGRRGSDYGLEMAASLARGLAASGVTILATLHSPVGRAAHEGTLEARSGAVAVLGGGLDAPRPRAADSVHCRLLRRGCAVTELPAAARGRGWGAAAAERIEVRLARAVVVIEAEDDPESLAAARLAGSIGRALGAIPGSLTSPFSSGPHRLLSEGASLVRGAEDVLELLDEQGIRRTAAPVASASQLPPRLARVLDAVGAGLDTPERLAGLDGGAGGALAALGELEVLGLVGRTAGGRYLCRDPVSRPA